MCVCVFKCVGDVKSGAGESARRCRREKDRGRVWKASSRSSAYVQVHAHVCCVAPLVSGLLTCRSRAASGDEVNAWHKAWE